MPRLVVIMPAFNAAHTIAAAIESAMQAAGADVEVAVFDDASTDDTASIAEACGQNVRVIRSETNRGSGFGRRRLVEATDSEFVANLDADDICLPWRFRQQLSQIKNYDFVFSTTFKNVDRPPWFRPSQPFPSSARDVARELLLVNPLPHSSFVARRSVLEAVGSYLPLARGQDYELWLRTANHGIRMRKFAVPVCQYRVHHNQVSAQSGYRSRVAGIPEIVDQYRELLQRAVSAATLEKAGEAGDLGLVWSELIGQLPAWKRPYYKRLKDNGLLFGQEPTLTGRLL